MHFANTISSIAHDAQHEMAAFGNAMIQAVVGSGLAFKLRLREFNKEVHAGKESKNRAAHDDDDAISSTSVTTRSVPHVLIDAPYPSPTASRPSKPKLSNSDVNIHNLAPNQRRFHRNVAVSEVKVPKSVKQPATAGPIQLSADSSRCFPTATRQSQSTTTSRVSFESNSSKSTSGLSSVGDDLNVLRFGRYRHFIDATPEKIKDALYKELDASEDVNWYGFDGLHPLAYLYNKRGESISSSGSEDVPEPLSPSASICPSTRHAWKTRTIPRDSVASDGCVIQRGFVPGKMPPVPGSPSTESSPSSGEKKRPLSHSSTNQSWHVRPASHVTDEDLCETKCTVVSAHHAGKQMAHRSRGQVPRASTKKRNTGARNQKPQSCVSALKHGHDVSKKRLAVRIVEAEEAENAIESDDDEWMSKNRPAPRVVQACEAENAIESDDEDD